MGLPNTGQAQQTPAGQLTLEDLKTAQKVAALDFTDDELKAILNSVNAQRNTAEALRKHEIGYEIEPPTIFVPYNTREDKRPAAVRLDSSGTSSRFSWTDSDLGFLNVRQLAILIREKKISSEELTKVCLNNLKTKGKDLLAVVTVLEEQALRDARKADAEIAQGKPRGLLHGIPTGVKDLFALAGAPTTWGAEPYKDQSFDYDSAVVEKLRDSGAVICAKLTLGALAQGDVWFGGRTKNPWNPEQGSSGSSAGSCACVAAGLLPYAIGTETLGSIMSPSHRCRVTGLRPSYGRISRFGAMAVSWTMDKVGPICRDAEDCAIVFSELQGHDPRDRSSVSKPFQYAPRQDLKGLKIGFIDGTEPKWLPALKGLGAELRPVKITPPLEGSIAVLGIEAAAAFDEFTRTDLIDKLTNSSWPITYRSNRFASGVDYLRAMQARSLVMRKFEEDLGDLDLLAMDERGLQTLFITNLTGHPQILIPFGADEKGVERSVSFVGRLYEEDMLLSAAHVFQQQFDFVKMRPGNR
jgi:Asp-tRNA(Asn)/Glu-tRNA(Gln) amidotransferase A subunit family amidase